MADVIIPREFSKSKEQIDKLQQNKKKEGLTKSNKKEMEDLKKEVEMTVHKISSYEGICEVAAEMGFEPPTTIEKHMEQGLSSATVDVRLLYSSLLPQFL